MTWVLSSEDPDSGSDDFLTAATLPLAVCLVFSGLIVVFSADSSLDVAFGFFDDEILAAWAFFSLRVSESESEEADDDDESESESESEESDEGSCVFGFFCFFSGSDSESDDDDDDDELELSAFAFALSVLGPK